MRDIFLWQSVKAINFGKMTEGQTMAEKKEEKHAYKGDFQKYCALQLYCQFSPLPTLRSFLLFVFLIDGPVFDISVNCHRKLLMQLTLSCAKSLSRQRDLRNSELLKILMQMS